MSDTSFPRTRLSDVADVAGVSLATASKALNGRSDVSATTRARVARAAQELGYSAGAGSYPMVTLVADEMRTTYTLEILRGAITEAMRSGVGLMTFYTPQDDIGDQPLPLSDEWFDLIRTHELVGVVVVTARLDERQLGKAREKGHLLVAIDPANALPPSVPSIGSTNWNGGVQATQHLIDLGHRRIGYIGGPEESVPARERLQGYLSALSMNDIEMDPRLVVGDSFSWSRGVELATALLSFPPNMRPTAIFGVADNVALGAYEAARRLNLRVPDDVSIVGFDDSLTALHAAPGLTTVRQSLEEMGAASIRYLVDRRAGRGTTDGPIRLATHMVIRESTTVPLSDSTLVSGAGR